MDDLIFEFGDVVVDGFGVDNSNVFDYAGESGGGDSV